MAEFDPNTKQFDRKCTLIVGGQNFVVANRVGALDLSAFRIKFSVKRSDTATPNTADILVYNVDRGTALKIQKEFKTVVLQAGYPGNQGVIFSGNIKQVILGRESATDTFVNLVCGDGDRAYNWAVVNESLAKGAKATDQVNSAVTAMTPKGVTLGNEGDLPAEKLPRGKTMFGNAREVLRNVAKTTDRSWSIQNGKVTFVKKTSYLPGDIVKITSATGMIGTPQQTTDGVNVKCLLNPNIQVSGRIHIDNETILQQKLNLDQIAAAKGDVSQINFLLPRNLNADGTYYVLVLEHLGDTRGTEWYTSLTCLNIDVSSNPLNAVTGGNRG